MAFDPAADPIVGQTVQGVTANDLKSYGHAMDLFVHQLGADLLEEGRQSRALSRATSHALSGRLVEVILSREVSDASSDAVAGNLGLDANQVGAKVAQTTPPETGIVTALGQLQALYQSSQQQMNQVITQLMALLGQNPVGTAKP